MHILVPAALAVIAVLLFGFVIFFHELGHFLLAKAMGVKVNEFSLGMGPKLWGFARKDTQYSLRLLPIGGYCAMEGEEEDSGSQGSFSGKPVWKRILVVVAGGLFNVVLGFGLMVIVLSQQEVFATTTISQFAEGSALEQAGAQVGDTIKEIDGYAVLSERDLTFALALADPKAVSMEVEREGRRVDLGTFPLHTQTLEDGSQMVTLDFYVQPEEVTVLSVLRRGVTDTLSMARIIPAFWVVLAALVLLFSLSSEMDILALGRETAQSLGLLVKPLRLVLLALAAALAGAAVSFAGLLGFVGLIVPHIMRRAVGEDSLPLLASCALGGASLLTLCDLLSRVLFAPYEIPVGIVLSLAGGPFFIWLLLRQRGGRIS